MDDNKNVNTNSTSSDGEVKKKKFSVVFRAQNSQQNSLKQRPAAPAAPKKPAAPARPAGTPGTAPAGTTRPAGSTGTRPAGTSAQTSQTGARPAGTTPVKPAQPAARPAGTTTRPATETPAARPAKKEEPVAPEAAKTVKPAVKEAEAAKPKTTPKAETPSEEKKTSPAAGTMAAKAPAASQAKPEAASAPKTPATQKPAAPATPTAPKAEEPPKPAAPRFVDMGQVRAAEIEAKNRSARLSKQQEERRNARKNGTTAPASGTRRDSRPGTPGQGSGTGRPAGQDSRFRSQGTGSQTGYAGRGTGGNAGAQRGGFVPKDKDDAARPARRPAAGSRSASGVRSEAFESITLQKNGGKNSRKDQKPENKNSKYNKPADDEMRRPGGKAARGKGMKDLEKVAKAAKPEVTEPQIKTITIPEKLTLKELAEAMKLQPAAIIKKLFMAGKVYTVNQEIDYDTAADIALEFEVIAEKEEQVNVLEELLKDTIEDKPEDLVPRPPVVCVMGHVDHGKTSLLDAIRKTNVISGEAGGITQHIGAYMVEINGQKITFLDTPGHEAFTAMRMRGAQATDIAILVVAADDGVMPQTVEAINHAKAAGVEIVVAINKIDKPGANIDKVKKELSEYGLIGEEWGGTNIFVPVSAKRGDGIEELLEMLLLVAEVHELKANPNRAARGLVIEAQLDSARGPVATVLVQKGTLHVGDTVAAGSSYGKIRAMLNEKGERVATATPGCPVEILGLNAVPSAGEVFISTKNEKDARSYAETFIAEGRKKMLEETKSRMSLDDLFSQIQAGNVKELNLIVKADVQGSVEAVRTSLTKLSNSDVVVKVIHSGAGNINESDVVLAAASNAIIIGFNVKPDAQAKSVAEEEKVDIRLYSVIYKAIEDIENAMIGMLDPIFEEQILGHAVIRQVFKASGVGNIAGSYVLDGKITRGCKCRVTRGKDQIFDGPLASLKRFKDDVKEVAAGYECGLVFEKFGDVAVDDAIEAYTMVEVPRTLPKKN